jgi:hypothetical protein
MQPATISWWSTIVPARMRQSHPTINPDVTWRIRQVRWSAGTKRKDIHHLEIGFMRLQVSLVSALLAARPPAALQPLTRTFRAGAIALQDRDVPQVDLRDTLKVGFARDEDTGPKTSFVPDSSRTKPAAEVTLDRNEQLLAEIRALQPRELPPPPVRVPVDLNGINPLFLVLGAVSYGTFSFFAWQFTNAAAEFFADHPMVRASCPLHHSPCIRTHCDHWPPCRIRLSTWSHASAP